MRTDRWKQVESIVAAALELDVPDRGEFVTKNCGDDHELRLEVEGLLAGDKQDSAYFEMSARDLVGGLGEQDPPSAGPPIGSVIGKYRLDRLIGAGGMGMVFLVSRSDEEYEQRAALKLIHGGMANNQLIRRFRTERQILAVFEHPNIARLLDGGTTADGRPYLVMEHVEGPPIDRYCDERMLDVRERIELFLKVCDAVAYAHRNLVIHRDLKPGNILTTEDGTPKLLDFGISKLLDPSAVPGGGTLTRTGLRPMSPAYASPEQIRGQRITTTSDVYSLGVVLYLMLTGELPRRMDDLTPVAMERELSRQPKSPSVWASENSQHAPVPARRLRGDLDAIILKALREEPDQRYTSAGDLAVDLQRYLDGLPVRARRGTSLYRAGRFARRNAVVAAVSILVGATLIGSTIALLLQNKHVTYERDRADKMAQFSSGVVAMDMAYWTIENRAPASMIIGTNLTKLEYQLSPDPILRSDQLMLLARGYSSLGLVHRSEDLATRALALRTEMFGRHRPEERPLFNDLAAIYYRSGQISRALTVLQETFKISRVGTDADDLEIARSHSLLALVKWTSLEHGAAAEHIDRSLELTTRAVGEEDGRIGDLKILRAYLDVTADPTSPATVASLVRAVNDSQSKNGGGHLEWSAILHLVGLLRSHGEFQTAIDYVNLLFGIDPQFRGPGFHDLSLTLGSLYLLRGEFKLAAPLIGIDHYSAYEPWSHLLVWTKSGTLRLELGDLDLAQEDVLLILSWLQKNRRTGRFPGEPWESVARQQLAMIELYRGELNRTRWSTAESLRLAENCGFYYPMLITSSSNAAHVYYALGATETAETLLREVIVAWEDRDTRWSPGYVRSLLLLADVHAHTGDSAEAMALLEKTRGVVERQHAIDPSPRVNEQLAEIHRLGGDFHKNEGDLAAAHNEWREALRLLSLNPEGTIGADHHLIAGKTRLRLGDEDGAKLHAQVLYGFGWRWPEWVATMGK